MSLSSTWVKSPRPADSVVNWIALAELCFAGWDVFQYGRLHDPFALVLAYMAALAAVGLWQRKAYGWILWMSRSVVLIGIHGLLVPLMIWCGYPASTWVVLNSLFVLTFRLGAGVYLNRHRAAFLGLGGV